MIESDDLKLGFTLVRIQLEPVNARDLLLWWTEVSPAGKVFTFSILQPVPSTGTVVDVKLHLFINIQGFFYGSQAKV